MFRHRTNGRKPSDGFFEHFKSNVWHVGPRPTAETFKLGEDVYATSHVSAHVPNPDDSYRECSSLLEDPPNEMTTSFFDAAASDIADEDPANCRPMPRLDTESLWTRAGALDWGSCLSTSTAYFSNYSASSPYGFASSSCRFQSSSFQLPGDLVASPSGGADDHEQSASSLSESVFTNDSRVNDSASAVGTDQCLFHELKQPRFLVSLDAPTAMMYQFESPLSALTYLNREQKYFISIFDTTLSTMKSTTYRASIQISFENIEQREHPEFCWEMWHSAHARKEVADQEKPLNGIEFVTSATSADVHQNPTVDLRNASSTEFSFTWTRRPNDPPTCQVPVRFHFVSTDFIHAKGIKGVPLRLSALIKEITPGLTPKSDHILQISYCLIKVFRNHGAERKRANDCVHIRKKIEKIERLLASQKLALHAKASRDHVKSMAAAEKLAQKPKYAHKRQKLVPDTLERTSDGPELPEDHTLFLELAKLQLASGSSQNTTVFNLKGDEHDYPSCGMFTPETAPQGDHGSLVDPPGNDISDFSSMIYWGKEDEDLPSRSIFSINFPLTPQCGACTTFDHVCGIVPFISSPRMESPPSPSAILLAQKHMAGSPAKRIKVLDIDLSYRAPISAPAKAALCVYVHLFQHHRALTSDIYYRAAYLSQLSTRELIASVAARCDFRVPTTSILSAIHVSAIGNITRIDDEFVHGIAQGQDMSVELIGANTEMEMDTESDPSLDNFNGVITRQEKIADKNRHGWYLKLRF